MVSGRAAVLTAGSRVSQCAEMQRMASGRPSVEPRPLRNSRAGMGLRGKVGAPCETKMLGSLVMAVSLLSFVFPLPQRSILRRFLQASTDLEEGVGGDDASGQVDEHDLALLLDADLKPLFVRYREPVARLGGDPVHADPPARRHEIGAAAGLERVRELAAGLG